MSQHLGVAGALCLLFYFPQSPNPPASVLEPGFLTNTLISLGFFLCFWTAFSEAHFATWYSVSLCLVDKILFGLDFQISYPLALPPFGQLPRELLSLPLHSENAIYFLSWFSSYHIDNSHIALCLSIVHTLFCWWNQQLWASGEYPWNIFLSPSGLGIRELFWH